MNAQKNILFVSHYAGRTGAPIVLKHHLAYLKKQHPDFGFDILLKAGGELSDEFDSIADTYYLPQVSLYSKIKRKLFGQPVYYASFLKKLFNNKYKIIYCNTVATADILVNAKKIDSKLITICHVHELEMAIKQFCGEQQFFDAIPFIDHFIAASIIVKKHLVDHYKIDEKKIHIHYEYIPLPETKEVAAEKHSALKIFGSGTLDWRKGIDLFVQIAYQLNKLNPEADFEFCWIGGTVNSLDYEKVVYDVKKCGIDHRVTIIPNCPNPFDYLKNADLFLLTSREDPFPLICLEAASMGKPVMCFKDSGGMVEFVNDENGWLVDYIDVTEVTNVFNQLLNDDSLRQNLPVKGELSRSRAKEFDIEIGGEKLYKYLEAIC